MDTITTTPATPATPDTPTHIPTMLQLFQRRNTFTSFVDESSLVGQEILAFAKEVAELHVTAALFAAAEKARIIEVDDPELEMENVYRYNSGGADDQYVIKQDSILNAYSLNNIK